MIFTTPVYNRKYYDMRAAADLFTDTVLFFFLIYGVVTNVLDRSNIDLEHAVYRLTYECRRNLSEKRLAKTEGR